MLTHHYSGTLRIFVQAFSFETHFIRGYRSLIELTLTFYFCRLCWQPFLTSYIYIWENIKTEYLANFEADLYLELCFLYKNLLIALYNPFMSRIFFLYLIKFSNLSLTGFASFFIKFLRNNVELHFRTKSNLS